MVETPTVAAIPSTAAAGNKLPPRFMPTSRWSYGANLALGARNATLIVLEQPKHVLTGKAQNGVTPWASTDRKRPIIPMVMAGPISFHVRRK
jgi:hypothetical protein